MSSSISTGAVEKDYKVSSRFANLAFARMFDNPPWVNEDRFWEIVEFALTSNAGNNAFQRTLRRRLSIFPPTEILEFSRVLQGRIIETRTNDLDAAASLLKRASDAIDLLDFRCGLVMLGRHAFKEVLGNPDSLIDLMWAGDLGTDGLGIWQAVEDAYQIRSGEPLPESAIKLCSPRRVAKEGDLARRLPRLYAAAFSGLSDYFESLEVDDQSSPGAALFQPILPSVLAREMTSGPAPEMLPDAQRVARRLRALRALYAVTWMRLWAATDRERGISATSKAIILLKWLKRNDLWVHLDAAERGDFRHQYYSGSLVPDMGDCLGQGLVLMWALGMSDSPAGTAEAEAKFFELDMRGAITSFVDAAQLRSRHEIFEARERAVVEAQLEAEQEPLEPEPAGKHVVPARNSKLSQKRRKKLLSHVMKPLRPAAGDEIFYALGNASSRLRAFDWLCDRD